MAAWADLPAEVLADVFSRLSFEERYNVVVFVCCGWGKAAREPGSWECADMEPCFAKNAGNWKTAAFERKMERMVRNVVDWSRGRLLELHTRRCSDGALADIASRCPHLRALTIKDSPGFTDWSATQIAAACRKLEYVDISECQNVSARFLKELGLSCGNLVTLKRNMLTQSMRYGNYFQTLPTTTSDEEASMIGGLMPGLQHLELRHTLLSDLGLGSIVDGCPNLQHLDLYGCNRLTAVALKMLLSRLPDLRIVELPDPSVPLNYVEMSSRYGHWNLYSNRFQDQLQF